MARASGLDALVAVSGLFLGAFLVRQAMGPSSQTRSSRPFRSSGGEKSAALLQLLAQIDQSYPARARGADGMLPSAAHHAKNPTSDHETGNALDVTADPMNGPNLDQLAADLLRDGRTKYVIWNRQIANPSIDGGAWRPYALTAVQTDPHTSHLHVSVQAERRDDAGTWSLVVVPKPPAGFAPMSDAHVTPEMRAWAVELVRDKTFGMGDTRRRDFGGRAVLARAEVHGPSAGVPRPHRGVSLFEAATRAA